jgi:4,5-dihydroxyphthalate decarboxylase
MLTKTEKLKLHTLLGNYPNVLALKKGEVTSDLVEFDFADIKMPHTGFKPLVRESRFDLGELAVVTYLQAKAYGKPYVLIPATVLGRGQLQMVGYNAERGALRPQDLAGKRVGVRAYTQTTGAWVRGILGENYGVDVKRVRWVTFEDPHLAEYRDPDFVERAPAGKELTKMLLDGEIDAAIGADFSDPRVKPLVPDAEAVGRQWAESHGGIAPNHMLVIRQSISQSRPDVVKDIFRVFREARQADAASKPGSALDPYRFCVEANRRSLETIIEYALTQQLIPRRFTVDELFDDVTRALGG